MEIKLINWSRNNQILIFQIDRNIYKAKIIKYKQEEIHLYIFNFKKTFIIKDKNKKFTPAKKSDFWEEKLISPLCGRVIKIHKKENDKVKKGEALVTIESMKMENEIQAKTNSFIKTISIRKGDLVQQDQTLIIFKKEKKGEINGTTKNKNSKT